jgi:branched-chain amino acid transport system permease protein
MALFPVSRHSPLLSSAASVSAGAVIGGILIGLIETMWSAYFSIDYKDVAAFSVLAITLIFLPQGLFGRPDVEKV